MTDAHRFQSSQAASWFMDRLFSTPWLSHHPPCRCYDGHVFRCGKLVLCLGCTCLGAGLVIASATCAWLKVQGCMGFEWLSAVTALGSGVMLYLPTLLQPYCQWKPYKIMARFLLGMGVVGILAGGLLLPPLDSLAVVTRVVFVPIFWLVFKATLRQRARFTPDPCSRCSPAMYPFCENNRPRVAALLTELRRRAKPEDKAFVAFATALAGEDNLAARVEIMPLRSLAAAGAHRQSCYAASDGQRSARPST